MKRRVFLMALLAPAVAMRVPRCETWWFVCAESEVASDVAWARVDPLTGDLAIEWHTIEADEAN